MTEDQLEQEALGWLADVGYSVVYGPDIAPDGPTPERDNYRQVILTGRLRAAIGRLNPGAPAAACDDALKQVMDLGSPALLAANRRFHQLLVTGVPVQYQKDGETRGDFVRLLNWADVASNDWLAVNQFSIKGPQHTRRPDIILFVNGLPLVLLEIKNPADENANVWKAYDQLQTYKAQIPDVFQTNEILVISDGTEALMGSLSSDAERFMAWRTIDGQTLDPLGQFNELQTLVRGVLAPQYLLDYLRYFVLFEDDGVLLKKIAGYHQFHAVRMAITKVIEASRLGANASTRGKGGVVWHTQGSGKSITMTCFAARVMQEPLMDNPTIVVISDRNDLDGQLFGVFSLAQDLLREQPVQARTRQELRVLLNNRPSGGIVFATIQKFMPGEDEDTFPVLSARHNIVVLADEAHRTQYGFEAKLRLKKASNKSVTQSKHARTATTVVATGSGIVTPHRVEFESPQYSLKPTEPAQVAEPTAHYQAGYAQHLRDALPNATFVAFTGTPVSSSDRDTRAVFGDYIHIYDMQQSKEDGATVAIYYESRLAKLSLKDADLQQLDEDVDELAEDDERDDSNQQAALKSRWAALEKVVGAEPRIESVAADLVAHFEERNKAQTGKAMVVAMSRDICAHLYNEIIKLRPDWHDDDPEKGAIKIVMTGSASDKALLRPHIYSAQVKKRLEKRFKDPADPLRTVIVRDMWLTGFDAPCVHTLYVDKPMKGHNLMQAIARVNRVFKDKQGGLVVDYIGIGNELKLAMKEYTASQGRGRPTVDAQEALSVLLEKVDVLRAMLHGFDYSGFLTGGHRDTPGRPQVASSPRGAGAAQPAPRGIHALLAGVANHVLGLVTGKTRDGKKRFADNALAMSQAFTLCCTLDDAKAVREEVAFLQGVKVILTKKELTAKKRTDEQRELAIRQIISSAVVSENVVDIFDAVGLDKPNIGLLDDEFLAQVRDLPERNLAVELLERLLQGEIKSRFAGSVVQDRKFSSMLQDVIARYQNRSIETAQVMEELIAMAKKFREASLQGEKLGLSEDEVRFYFALIDNESAVRELSDETLKKIAHELTENLRLNLSVDWSARESVQAKLRLMVKRILRKYKYPPDHQDAAVELVLEQVQAFGDGWGA